jgi:hypothetical protein
VISELSLVVATAEFSTVFPDVKSKFSTFSGTVSLEQDGEVVLRYLLSWELMAPAPNQVVQYRSFQTRASVRLRTGEAVQILNCDTFACRVSVTRLSDQKGKDK